VCYYGTSNAHYAHRFAAPLSHLIGALFCCTTLSIEQRRLLCYGWNMRVRPDLTKTSLTKEERLWLWLIISPAIRRPARTPHLVARLPAGSCGLVGAYPVITTAFAEAFKNIAHGANVKAELDKAAQQIDQDIKDNNGYSVRK
jgi:hypothetical protein